MSLRFHGSKLKVERATHHISELQGRLDAFIKNDFCHVTIEKHPDPGYSRVKIETTGTVPSDFALLIGDALNNLRTALDFIASDIVFEKTGVRSTYTKFPIFENRQDLVNALNRGTIKRANRVASDFILNTIQPYKAGNYPVWALHTLNIVDKHRLLIPVVDVAKLLNVSIVEREHNISISGISFEFPQGGVAGSMPFAKILGLAEVADPGKPSLDIFFDQGLPTQGEAVIPTLHKFAELVSGIVERFETL